MSATAAQSQMGFQLVRIFTRDDQKTIASDQIGSELPFATTKIVGLGEVAHASGDLHNLAGELILKMAALSVVDILIEAPRDAINPIQNKIAAGAEIEAADLSLLYQVWRTPQMLSVLNRLSELNRIKPNSVSIRGIDIRLPVADFKEVLSSAPKSEQNENLIELCANQSRLRKFEVELASGKVDPSHLKTLSEVEKATSKAIAHDDAIYRLKLWLATYRKFGEDVPAGFSERDSGMFALARKQIELAKGRVIVWAHLGHLLYDNKTVKTPLTYLDKGEVLGRHLKKQFGADFQTVALLAKTVNLNDPEGKNHRFVTDPDSIECLLSPSDQSIQIFKFNSETLQDKGYINIGKSSTGSIHLKDYFPEMEISDQQFDFAAIIQGSLDG